MIEFLIFFSIIMIGTVVFTLTQAAISIIFSIQPKSIQLGFGKTLVKIKLKSFDICLGWIPGGSVEFDMDKFNERSLLIRLGIIGSGPISVIISSALFLTLDTSISELIKGFSQIYNLIFYPVSYGQMLFAGFVKFLNENSYGQSYGTIVLKMVAFNLLPFPVLTGGRLILEIFPLSIKVKIAMMNISFILLLGGIVSILYSFIHFLFL